MIVFIDILELLFVIAILYGVYTQIITPLSRGTLLFPYFRKRAILEQEVKKAKEEYDEKGLKQEAEKIKNKK